MQDWQDTALHDPVCDFTASAQHGWCRRQGSSHRHRRQLQAREGGADSTALQPGARSSPEQCKKLKLVTDSWHHSLHTALLSNFASLKIALKSLQTMHVQRPCLLTLLLTSLQIAVARAHNYEHQMELIGGIAGKMAEEPFKVLIVDSIIANFR